MFCVFFLRMLYLLSFLVEGMLAAYAPKLFAEYAEVFDALWAKHPDLKRNFSNSVYPAIAFNFGPRTVTYMHTDTGNKANGLCAITALGKFNPTRSGHLVLGRLRLVIEFPPGATVLIPSATVPHGNTPIQEGETRMSITQYAAGGLFRWVRYGFKNEKALRKENPTLAAYFDERKSVAWKDALGAFSTTTSLVSDRLNLSQ